MFRLLIVGLQLVAFLSSCEALTCVRCEGDPDDCADSQRVDNCDQFGQNQVCNNFYYWSAGKPTVQKGCYQKSACETQQGRPDNFCGEHAGSNRPCRCCCNTYRCNRRKRGCIVPSKCGKPRQPKIGRYYCPAKTRLGSVCNFTCPVEYDMVGAKKTICVRNGGTGKLGWSPLGQACRKIRCKKIFAPENGNMNCVNKGRYENEPGDNFLKTECTFMCNKGHKFVGAQNTVCKGDQTWSKKVPRCVIDPCEPIPTAPNRIVTCTDGFTLGSVCRFKCKRGYKIVGEEATECVGEKGVKVWDRKPPTCIRVKCVPEQDDPTHGSVSCTNGNFENSVCTFTCDKGYDIDGTAVSIKTITCLDDGDGNELGVWSDEPATCTRIECRPRLTKPGNGTVECTANNFMGSVCTFKCDEGYDMEDTARSTLKSTCGDDGDGNSVGEWSLYPPPNCTQIRCLPLHKDPRNGKVSCTDANNLGSVCKFRCNEGYDLDGTAQNSVDSECEDDGDGNEVGEWSRGPPTCTLIKCKLIVRPEHATYTCTNENAIGSTCEFECEYGYALIGERQITCKDRERDGNAIGEWTDKEPRCSQIFCTAQKHDNTVTQNCDPPGKNTFEVGTICTYTCAEEGHYLVSHERPTVVEKSGSLSVECLTTSSWDREAPRCIRVTCKVIPKPDHAHPPSCSDSNWLGSVCGFTCEPTYALTHTDPLVCESDGTDDDKIGKWSRGPPECEKNECGPLEPIRNGRLDYSNEFKIGSVANLTCNGGYTYKHYEASECLPKGDGRKEPAWSRLSYVNNLCCVTCIFNKRLRIVSVVDKTAAQNTKEWEDIVTWHYYLLDFLYTKDYDIKFGMVLYDDTVDSTNSISEKKMGSLDDVEDIQYAMYDFPHGGRGSDTAGALDYAKSTYFRRYTTTTTSRRPKEEPYIIVIKSPGSAEDASEVAQRLLGDRIHILALGFKNGNSKAEEKDLVVITGDSKRVAMIGGIPDVLKVGERITEISISQGCSSTSRNQPCT